MGEKIAQPSVKEILVNHVKSLGGLLWRTMKNPVEVLLSKENVEHSTRCIMAWVLQWIVILITLGAYMPLVNHFVFMETKTRIAVFIIFVNIGIVISNATIAYALGRKGEDADSYKSVIATFCIATIPGTIFYIISYVVSFVSILLAIVILAIGFISWGVLVLEAVAKTVGGHNTTVYWTTIIIAFLTNIVLVIAVSVILYFIVRAGILRIIVNIMEIISEFIRDGIDYLVDLGIWDSIVNLFQ